MIDEKMSHNCLNGFKDSELTFFSTVHKVWKRLRLQEMYINNEQGGIAKSLIGLH